MRLKDFTQLNPTYNGQFIDDDVSFVPMESLRNDEIDQKEIPFSQATGKYTFFADGDLLIAKVTPCFENGNIAIARNLKHGIGFGSSEIFVLRMDPKKALNTYMFYVSETEDFQAKACATMHGVGGLKRIDPLFMRTYEIEMPSIEVQQRIVSYLDAETAKIDKAIELLRKKRNAYTRLKSSVINRAVTRGLNPNVKLKDSGVEWIGMIPEGWNWHRMKDLGYMYSGLTGKSGDDFRCDDLSQTKPYIPFTNVLNHIELDPNQLNQVVMAKGEQQNMVKENDLIFLMSSEDYESIAKSALVASNLGEVYLNSFCRGFRPTNNDVNSKFVNYELNSDVYRNGIRYEARGFTRINIKVDRIETMYVVLPPITEQQSIASYLDSRCARIDKATAIVDKQIDAYTRLKKSLINEVVTGKRRV